MLNRRQFIAATGAASLTGPSFAQTETVRIMVGFPPGGIVDIIAREMTEAMRPHLGGRNIIVEAKLGAGGRYKGHRERS
jgi:tripartite-type tricarboxylate transporter receptor subunit TctC